MKIVVKIEDIEVSYEEPKHQTTKTQDKDLLNMCYEKAIQLYFEKLKHSESNNILEQQDE